MPGRPNCSDLGRVIAHRGASAVAPENTLAAFRLAAEQGARSVEFDVSLLGDGTPILIHDATLDRCSDTSGRISEISRSDLSAIDAGAWKSPRFAGERIPTLDAALEALAKFDLCANLELKPHDCETGALAHAVASQLQAFEWSSDRIITSSFSLPELQVFRETLPQAPVAVLYDDPPSDWLADLSRLNAAAMHLNWRYLSQSLLVDAKTRGFDVRVFTANDPDILAPFREHGLAGVITDHPPLYLEHPDWKAWNSG